MKPQITALALHRLYVGGWLQRSCGMKPQITTTLSSSATM